MGFPTPKLKKIRIAQKKKRLIELMRQEPDLTQQGLADALGVNRSTVSRYLKEINEELNMQTVEDFMIQRHRILAEIHEKKQLCMDKLDKLKNNPHQGARWMEEYSKLLEKEIRIYGVYSPEKMMIKHSQEFTKEQRDAAIGAAVGLVTEDSDVIDIAPKLIENKNDKPEDDKSDDDNNEFETSVFRVGEKS